MRLVSADSKYTFYIPNGDYRVHILRFSEPWVVIEKGHKAISTLMHELEEAREKLAGKT